MNTIASKDAAKDTLDEPATITKYQTAGEIANKALAAVLAEVRPGASVLALCVKGDETVAELTSKVYTKGKVPRGSAYPTAVSVNNCVDNFSPADADEDVTIADGDVVKVQLGAHIDGFVALVAHTVVATDSAVKDRRADVVHAAHAASEVAHRLFREGSKSPDIQAALLKTVGEYDCSLVRNILSHQVKQFVFKAAKTIPNWQNPDEQLKRVEVEGGDVFVIDILVSTGEGKVREQEARANIFRQNPEKTYHLKTKTSRTVFAEISSKFTAMPFNARALESENARFGVTDGTKNGLLEKMPVTYEREGQHVAHFMFTSMMLPSGPTRITAGPALADNIVSDKKIEDEEITEILSKPAKEPKKKKNKKKAEAMEQ